MLSKYWKVLIIVTVVLGLAMFVPSPLSEPNYSGISLLPIVMFVLATSFYLLATKHRKALFATIVMLLALFAYTGFWTYNYKMPLSSLKVTLVPKSFYNGLGLSLYETFGNECCLSFCVLIQNPTDIDTPPFMIENIDFYLNNRKLENYDRGNWGQRGDLGGQGTWYFNTHTIIRSHQTLNISRSGGTSPCWISIYSNYTQIEGDNLESIWESLIAKNFTLTFTGSFTSRPNFKIGDYSRESMVILATAKFTASCRFDEI